MKKNRSNYGKMEKRAMEMALSHKKQLEIRGITVLTDLSIVTVEIEKEYKIQVNTYDYIKVVIEGNKIMITVEKV